MPSVVSRIVPVALSSMMFFLSCTTTSPPSPRAQPQESRGNRLTPVARSPRDLQQPIVTVGLLSDQATARFERVDGGYVIFADGPHVIRRGFSVHAPLEGQTVRYAVQVAALSDQKSAEALAGRIRTESGQPALSLFDAAGGVYKILAGDFESEDAARPLRDQLVERGYERQMMIVRRPAERTFETVLRIVDDEGDRHTFEAPSILVLPVESETVRIGDTRYRGGARLFINNRGLLNVINELNLEDYVRGVVPNEMGPSTYDELEALKAQALAARTYVVKRKGDYRSEGYDICATPACQVYRGFTTEHALSDQAVRETAGTIITYQGQPIDALYTSTCGGETSNVATMFPGRTEPYLRRVRCVELDLQTIAGRSDSAFLTEMQVDARIFARLAGLGETATSWSGGDVGEATRAAARLAGVTLLATTPPRSSRRGDVLEHLAAAWGLAPMSRLLTLPEDRRYFFPRSDDPDSVANLAAAFMIKYQINPPQTIDAVDLASPMPRDELFAILLSWLREQNGVQEVSGRVFSIAGRQVELKAAGRITRVILPEGALAFRRLEGRLQEYARLPVLIGDRATVVQLRNAPTAIVVQENYDGAAFDRTSSFSNWTRSYRADELVASISRRNAIRSLSNLQTVSVDESGRVVEMNVIADDGRAVPLSGIVIRWSLNLPDNLFTWIKSKDPDGMDRYTFFGKGWGHGTGMCQVGAYGMGFRGWSAERIIRHFYTGVELTRVGE